MKRISFFSHTYAHTYIHAACTYTITAKKYPTFIQCCILLEISFWHRKGTVNCWHVRTLMLDTYTSFLKLREKKTKCTDHSAINQKTATALEIAHCVPFITLFWFGKIPALVYMQQISNVRQIVSKSTSSIIPINLRCCSAIKRCILYTSQEETILHK